MRSFPHAPARALLNSATAMTFFNLMARYGGLALLLAISGRYLAASELAFFYLFSGIFSATFLLVQGLVPTVARYLAHRNTETEELNAAGRKFKAVDLIATASRLHFRIALALALLMLTLGSWAVNDIINLSGNRAYGWIAWGLMVLTAPVSIYATQYIAVLQGVNLIALEQRWSAAVTGMGYIVGVISLILFRNVLVLIGTLQLAQLANAIRLRLLVSRLRVLRAQGSGQGEYSSEISAFLWPDVVRMTFGGLMTAGVTNLSGFVLARRLGAVDLASTLMATRVMLAVVEVARAPFYSQIPVLNILRSTNHLEKLALFCAHRMRLALWLFLVVALTIGVLGNYFLRIIGSSVELPTSMAWMIFTIAFLFDRSAAMHNQIYLTTHHVVWHWFAAGHAFVTVLLMALLPSALGVFLFPVSVGLGTIFVLWIPAVVLSVRSLKLSVWGFERTVLVPPLLTFLAICIIKAYL